MEVFHDGQNQIQKEKMNPYSNVKKVIAVMSGKGGVGKSTVTGLIATSLNDNGYKVGVLDADITGPSIPKIFGVNKQRVYQGEHGIMPIESVGGIKLMSVNLIVENEEDPVVWRGPILANSVKQFYTDVVWGDLDYLVIDMPPGTGDVPLTVMQSIHVDNMIMVTSPQSLVGIIVKKSINMAKMLNVPLTGFVENMSYFQCDNCDKVYHIFGKSQSHKIEEDTGLPCISKIPLDPLMVELADEGKLELYMKTNYKFAESFFKEIKTYI